MPELPEVETIKRGLAKSIIGKTIADVDVRVAKIFHGRKEDILGAKILNIKRRAKMIIIGLNNSQSLLIHLKMTGQLVFDQKPNVKSTRTAGGHPSKELAMDLPNKYSHAIFKFSDKSVLYFNDMRKFGYIKIYATEQIDKLKVLSNLGPDPIEGELKAEYLKKAFSKRPKIKIKQILLDQTVISGVGNIYADEALFCAGISPLRLAKNIKNSELEKLIECIKKVMLLSLKYGGSSENTYVDSEGKKGQMQNYFQVYRKTGDECPRGCGEIVRTVVGGRGTHYCPKCQK